ncbi:MAG: sigma-70 family RNA polymerase sigma factor [Planctomycetes bacterium]|nr:sigma-70 family RNA polymerase sigma factor [Planctomycetota bacterium]
MRNPATSASVEALLAHRDWLRALLRQLIADEHAVDDAVQDTWLAALERPPRPSTAPRAWLRGVARNLSLRWRSGRERAPAIGAAAETPPVVPDPATVVEKEAARRRVVHEVLRLAPCYRDVVLLRFFEELPPREIARRLREPVETVRTRLKRALAILRERLDPADVRRAVAPLPLAPAIGVLAMALKWKVGIVIAALAAAGLVLVTELRRGVPPVPPEDTGPTATVAEVAAEAPQPAPVAGGALPPREEIEAPPPTPVEVPRLRGIRGSVRDSAGRPIAGATVTALERLRPPVLAAVAVRTDESGAYVLDFGRLDLPAMQRTIECAAAGFGSECREVRAGITQDFVLLPGGTLTGRIFAAADESPCPGTRITLSRYDLAWTDLNQRAPAGSHVTDESGVYRFASLKPGRYRIQVAPLRNPRPNTNHLLLHVRSGEVTHQDFALTTGVAVTGRVVDRATGEPVAGVTVSNWTVPEQKAVTDVEGRFRLVGVDPDETQPLRFTVEGKGYVRSNKNLGGIMLRGEQVGAEMQVGDVFADRLGTVSGRVLNPDGVPFEGARVRLHGGEAAITDGAGCFHLAGLNPCYADYQSLMVDADGYATHRIRLNRGKPGEARENVEVRLTRSGTITGRVTGPEGLPEVEAVVHASDGQQGYASTVTDADGRYELRVLAGKHCLSVVPRGVFANKGSPCLQAQREGVAVSEGASVTADIMLGRGAALAGRVVDQTGAGVEGVLVGASPQYRYLRKEGESYNSNDCRETISGPGGAFRVEGLHPVDGLYDLRADAPGYDPGHADRVSFGQDYVLCIQRLARLRGRVHHLETGEPARNFWIDAEPLEGAKVGFGQFLIPKRRFFAALDGCFDAPIRTGTYLVAAGTQTGSCSQSIIVEVKEGEDPLPVELALVPGAELAGTVFKPDGSPAANARIELVPVVGKGRVGLRTVRTDTQGDFSVKSLASGTYLLRACHPEDTTWGTELLLAIDQGRTTSCRVDLVPCPPLCVTVHGPDDTPVPAARIRVLRPDGTELRPLVSRWEREIQTRGFSPLAFSFTDADGVMDRRVLPPGDYVVEASKDGYRTASATLAVRPGVPAAVSLRLEKRPRGDFSR